jgi:VIT1/CCC1 family predicted Fe2+/Mn2+ transporter
MTIAIAILILGLLGTGISREVGGNPIYWATGLMAGGALLTAAGVFLHVA